MRAFKWLSYINPMDTTSKWLLERPIINQKKLKSGKYDVVIIGAGITGITTAYLLAKSGKKVCLLERDRVGGIDTSRTTAHLTYVTDIRIHEIVKFFDKNTARLVWQAGNDAIDKIEAIAKEEGVDCEFKRVPAYLLTSLLDGKNSSDLKADYDEANNLKFDVSYPVNVPYFERQGIEFANQALFHPSKFIKGLASKIEENGGDIFEDADVSTFEQDPLSIRVNGEKIEAKKVIIATHVPLMGNKSLVGATFFQSKLAPYSSYVLGARLESGLIREGSYWDLNDPYYYLRVERRDGYDYAIFGGEDHKTGQIEKTEQCYAKLEEAFKKIIPTAQIDARWSGQVIETNDGLPFIGEATKDEFIATGFSGNGMTFGVISALLAEDWIHNRTNVYSDIFSPSRFKIRGGTLDYIRENSDYPYYMIKDYVSNAPAASEESIQAGEGKIVSFNGKKTACYCDEKGKITCLSAICTHMGGIVHWNSAEKTWDCPCHGSRFHCTGEVMTGPAESPLTELASSQLDKKRESISIT